MKQKPEKTAKVVDLALYRMRTDAVVKEKRRTFARVAAVVAGLLAFPLLVSWLVMEKPATAALEPRSTVLADGSIQVTIPRGAHGHYVFAGYLNGKKVEFLVDTGATLVAVPQKYQDHFGLVGGDTFQTRTANGNALVYQTTIDSIRVGEITLHNIRGVLSPGMSARDDVLLGMSFLQQLRMIQEEDRLILMKPGMAYAP